MTPRNELLPPASEQERAWLVMRRSLDEIKQEYSFDRQQHDNLGYVGRKGYRVVGQSTDNMTGSRIDRPGLTAALTAAERGDCDVIIVSSLDRLSRDNLVFQVIVAKLRA